VGHFNAKALLPQLTLLGQWAQQKNRQVPHQASVRQATAAASRFGIGAIAPFFNEAKPKLLKTQT